MSAWCKAQRPVVSVTTVSRVLNGREAPTRKLLAAMGLQQMPRQYEALPAKREEAE